MWRGRKLNGFFLFSSISRLTLLGGLLVCHMHDLFSRLYGKKDTEKKANQTNK